MTADLRTAVAAKAPATETTISLTAHATIQTTAQTGKAAQTAVKPMTTMIRTQVVLGKAAVPTTMMMTTTTANANRRSARLTWQVEQLLASST
jgi:hypothetical protein